MLIQLGGAAYDDTVGTPCDQRGTRPYHGPTLRDGRVCIKVSPHGGRGGRGLFPGDNGVSPSDEILYSGEVISSSEAKARKERGNADYIVQLSYRPDSERVDGRIFADAISLEPNEQGRCLPLEEWALDAGPGSLANEDRTHSNAKFELRWINSKQGTGPYRVIVPLRYIGPEEEIRPNYGSDTPRHDDL